MQNIAILAALGVAVQGAASDIMNTDWPKYATTSSASGFASTDLQTGGYGCIRNGKYFLFAQKLSAASPPVVETGTNLVTFYPSLVASLGTVMSTAAGAATDMSGCCNTFDTAANCAAGIFQDSGNSNAETIFAQRVVFGATATAGALAMPTWHTDLVLATTYQLSLVAAATRVTADYCDTQVQAFTAAADAAVTRSTMPGLIGKTKCSYIVTVAAGAGAPSFKVTKAEFMAFQLHFLEWAVTTGILQVPASNATPGFFGAYTGFFPSPIAGSSAFPSSGTDMHWAAPANLNTFRDLSTILPGSIGPLKYFPTTVGPFLGYSATAFQSQDSGIMFNDWMRWGGINTSFATAKGSYDTLKGTYNTDNATEIARKADFFKSMFEAPTAIPARPCKPDTPAAYSGPNLQFTDTWSAITGDVAKRTAGKARTDQTAIVDAIKTCFLIASTDTSAADATTQAAATLYAQHVMGRFGQGVGATVTAGMAYAPADLAAVATGLVVSIFPDVIGATGLATGKAIDIEVAPIAFQAYTTIIAPTQPTGAVDPDAAGAKALIAGGAALAAIAMTLA